MMEPWVILNGLEPKDLLDVLIVATIIYLVLAFVKQTRSFIIFNTFLLIFGVTYVATLFDLTLTKGILQPFITFFLVLFVIIYQREIKRFFEWLYVHGRRQLSPERRRTITAEVTATLVDAVRHLSAQKIGALIVVVGDQPLENITEGGFYLDGRITEPLLLSIFDPTSPGHDGAVMIENNRLRRFGVHLPLGENYNKKLGTRHRAAVGITERSDAMSIVVSEERGTISVALGGVLTPIEDTAALMNAINEFLKDNDPTTRGWRYLVTENWGIKIFSLTAAAVLLLLMN